MLRIMLVFGSYKSSETFGFAGGFAQFRENHSRRGTWKRII